MRRTYIAMHISHNNKKKKKNTNTNVLEEKTWKEQS